VNVSEKQKPGEGPEVVIGGVRYVPAVPAESRYVALGSKSIGYTVSGFKADVPVDLLRLVEKPE
jgi:hypothetical protein